MKTNYKIALGALCFVIISAILLASHYGIWMMGKEEDVIALNTSGCVSIIYSDNEEINIGNLKAFSKEDGMSTIPRTITVINHCETKENANLYLDVYNDSLIDDSKLNVYINGDINMDVTSLNNISHIISKGEISKTYKLAQLDLESHETKRVNFRIWLDQDATISLDKNNFHATYYVKSLEENPKENFAEVLLKQKVNPNEIYYNYPATENEGLIKVDDSYYFRGNVSNNYVKFADKMWRIVSVQQDNTIKLIYADEELNSVYQKDANKEEDVGYSMEAADSTVKTFLDNWYKENLEKYDLYLSEYNFCNDTTSIVDGNIKYSSYIRNFENFTPSINCNKTDKSYGGNIKSKIGLITADEVIIAGGITTDGNTNYYLYNGKSFYTMSPMNYLNNYYRNKAYVGFVDSTGKLDISLVNEKKEVRPVINLANYLTVKGNGSISNPYIIENIE